MSGNDMARGEQMNTWFGPAVMFMVLAILAGLAVLFGVKDGWGSKASLSSVGCWSVTDVTGHVTVFQMAPKYDMNVHAIAFENDGHAGWIFPARVDEDLLCAGNLPTPGATP